MNYDKAHDLAKAMRECEEYKELMTAQTAVEGDAVAAGLVRTFMAQQMQWEYAKLSGAPEEAELLKKQEELINEFKNDKKLIVAGILGAIGMFGLMYLGALIQYVYFLK